MIWIPIQIARGLIMNSGAASRLQRQFANYEGSRQTFVHFVHLCY